MGKLIKCRFKASCDEIDDGKTLAICWMSWFSAFGFSPLRNKPRMDTIATIIGNIARSKLYASMADRLKHQSLVNLVQKALMGEIPFSAVLTTSEIPSLLSSWEGFVAFFIVLSPATFQFLESEHPKSVIVISIVCID